MKTEQLSKSSHTVTFVEVGLLNFSSISFIEKGWGWREGNVFNKENMTHVEVYEKLIGLLKEKNIEDYMNHAYVFYDDENDLGCVFCTTNKLLLYGEQE